MSWVVKLFRMAIEPGVYFAGPALILVLHALAARDLGIHRYAAFSILYVSGGLLGMGVLGGCNILAYRAAVDMENGASHDRRRAIFAYFAWTRGLLVLPAVLAISWAVAMLTWNTTREFGITQLTFTLVVTVLAASFGTVTFSAHLLRSYGRALEASFAMSAAAAVLSLVIAATIKWIPDIDHTMAIPLGVTLGTPLAGLWALLRAYRLLGANHEDLGVRRIAFGFLRDEWRIFAASSAQIVLASTDVLLAGFFCPPQVVSIVAVVARVAQIPMAISGAFNQFSMVLFARRSAGPDVNNAIGHQPQLRELFAMRWVLISLLSIGLIAGGDNFLRYTFGPVFADVHRYVATFIAAVWVADLLGAPGVVLTLAGRQEFVARIGFFGIVLKVLLLVFLGQQASAYQVVSIIAAIWILNAILLAALARRFCIYSPNVRNLLW